MLKLWQIQLLHFFLVEGEVVLQEDKMAYDGETLAIDDKELITVRNRL